MIKLYRVKTENGYKDFTHENEANAFETEIALEERRKAAEKEKADAERKAREEKQNKLTEYRKTKLNEINEILQKSKLLVDDYEKTTGNKLIYTNDMSTGNIVIKETRNSIDYAWDNFFEDIIKAMRLK